MEKSELLQYLTSYLKHKVRYLQKFQLSSTNIFELKNFNDIDKLTSNDTNSKILVRPMEDFNKEINHNNEKFIPRERIVKEFNMSVLELCMIAENITNHQFILRTVSWLVVDKLLEWHFDVFDLINQNYAKNLNEIDENNPDRKTSKEEIVIDLARTSKIELDKFQNIPESMLVKAVWSGFSIELLSMNDNKLCKVFTYTVLKGLSRLMVHREKLKLIQILT